MTADVCLQDALNVQLNGALFVHNKDTQAARAKIIILLRSVLKYNMHVIKW